MTRSKQFISEKYLFGIYSFTYSSVPNRSPFAFILFCLFPPACMSYLGLCVYQFKKDEFSVCLFWTCMLISDIFYRILRNGVLFLNGKENKKATAICFQIRIPKKKTRNYYGKSHQKFMEVILLWKKTKTFFDLSIIPNIITEKWGY